MHWLTGETGYKVGCSDAHVKAADSEQGCIWARKDAPLRLFKAVSYSGHDRAMINLNR